LEEKILERHQKQREEAQLLDSAIRQYQDDDKEKKIVKNVVALEMEAMSKDPIFIDLKD